VRLIEAGEGFPRLAWAENGRRQKLLSAIRIVLVHVEAFRLRAQLRILSQVERVIGLLSQFVTKLNVDLLPRRILEYSVDFQRKTFWTHECLDKVFPVLFLTIAEL
jgi:hypothetical protein